MAHSTEFFDKFGWQGDSCATHFSNSGVVTSPERAIVAAGRKAYGYALSGMDRYRYKAQAQVQFILDRMVSHHFDGKPFFLETINPVYLASSCLTGFMWRSKPMD